MQLLPRKTSPPACLVPVTQNRVPCHGLFQKGSGHVAQQGLTLSALLASHLPRWVPRAPHICHPHSCQTHCFQAPQALPPPSRTRHRPQGLPYTPTSFSNSLPRRLCGDEKRLYKAEKENTYKMQNKTIEPSASRHLVALFLLFPLQQRPHTTLEREWRAA